MKQVNLTDRRFSFIFVVFCFLFGLYFRLSFVTGADFPINDGAMFTKIVEEILVNHFRMPQTTDYNFLNIPLAYPPLAFYLAAALAKITGVAPLVMMQYLPPILSSFTIPAFYYLSKSLSSSTKLPYLSTIIFMLIPQSWIWLIMGGGLTRSLALLFAILAVLFIHQFLQVRKKYQVLVGAFFASLTILSNPETGYFVVLSIILVFIIFSDSWRDFFPLTLVGGLVVLFTSPWWLRVILQSGGDPFFAALNTSGFGTRFIQHLVFFGITGEINSFNISVLAIIGFFYLIHKKKYFVPLWLLVILILTPRAGFTYAMIPVSLLSGVSLLEIIIPVFQKRDTIGDNPPQAGTPKLSKTNLVLLSYLLISLLLSAFLQPYAPDSLLGVLSEDERAAMKWVSENTPIDGTFLILTHETVWDDEISEWFPYLADRYSISTLQGSEWLSGDSFARKYYFYIDSIACLDAPEDCLEPLAEKYELTYTHVYLPLEPSSMAAETQAMYLYLKYNQEYTLLYDGPGAAIFRYAQAP